ncbi:hypothetical protein ACFOOM_22470 [Streptomyces echinoruber]|uniref:Uncharacterized protein n=1 Tax=Streptomyces echinoruber TaxID=68898 RepID=A0A918R2P9_9ACTN|nr:hypothetical protein [Streptomyces echinoruber]GGZ82346.1 hypothetical protein GCM10010389_20370 [Streptomyces echinoruber]
MKLSADKPVESVARFGAVLGAMGIGAALILTGHATVAEASHYVSSGIVYLTAVSGVKREGTSLGR